MQLELAGNAHVSYVRAHAFLESELGVLEKGVDVTRHQHFLKLLPPFSEGSIDAVRRSPGDGAPQIVPVAQGVADVDRFQLKACAVVVLEAQHEGAQLRITRDDFI